MVKKKYTVRVMEVHSVDIEVEANTEDEAYENAYSQWTHIEPDMDIVKVEDL